MKLHFEIRSVFRLYADILELEKTLLIMSEKLLHVYSLCICKQKKMESFSLIYF